MLFASEFEVFVYPERFFGFKMDHLNFNSSATDRHISINLNLIRVSEGSKNVFSRFSAMRPFNSFLVKD